MNGRYQPEGIHTANVPAPFPEFAATGPALSAFITIAQQVGAERPLLPSRLTEILNADSEHTWSCWDRELVDKVAAESLIPPGLIESLGSVGHSWIDDVLNGILGRVDEMQVFYRVKKAVHGLASVGHVILIGHGSTYMTRDLPGGLHVRLIAPMSYRIQNIAERFHLSPRDAARHMRRIDKQRERFFARFWPGQPVTAESFSAVLNSDELDDERIARAIAAMLPQQHRQGFRTSTWQSVGSNPVAQ